MGCDGGTIPRRDELVRTKKKKEEKDKKADIVAKWKYCAISSNKLTSPIVSCELGRLYNKDAVIEYLLNKEAPNSSLLSHIRNLKDVVTLKLTPKPGYTEKDSAGDQETDIQDSKYVCPIVGIEMNGMYKFYYIRKCGCVLSERAIKEVKSDKCLVCNSSFDQEDLIIINGTEQEMDQLRQKMTERRAKAKEQKKKRKAEQCVNLDKADSKSRKEQKTTAQLDDNNVTSKTKATTYNNHVKTSSLAVISEKASKEYSVHKDPNASEAYKSLFTTHESAKNRPKAHWVTFNPLYN